MGGVAHLYRLGAAVLLALMLAVVWSPAHAFPATATPVPPHDLAEWAIFQMSNCTAEPNPYHSSCSAPMQGSGGYAGGWVMMRTNDFGTDVYAYIPSETVLSCPADADLVNGQCVCKAASENKAGTTCNVPAGKEWSTAANAYVWVKTTDHTGEEPKMCGVGNPIYPLLGTKREVVDTGLSAGGVPIRLVYDSTPAAPLATGIARAMVAKPQVLGPLWSSSLHRQVLVQAGGLGALVARGDGRTFSFSGNGAGVFTAESDINDRLVSVAGGGYRYTDAAAQSQESYDSAGKLTAVYWVGGGSITFTYNSAGYLVQVQDSYGRSTGFAYKLLSGADPATGGLLSSITDAQGEIMRLAYDGQGNLASLTWADGKIRSFLYENANFPRGLTGITDELGVRYATFGYDSAGRAISTEHIGGLNRYSSTYGTPPQVVVTDVYDSATQVLYRTHDWSQALGTTVTDPQGASQAMGSTIINGKSYLTSQSQPAGSGCAASTSFMTYDANGNIASKDDFSGNRSCFSYDAKNRLTVTVEGLSTSDSCASALPANASLPSGSRKISSTPHTDWSLTTRVAQPLSIVTSVYNGQTDTFTSMTASCAPSTATLPDGKPIAVLCKQVVQATTDIDGHAGPSATLDASVTAKVSTFTYDGQGRVLSSVDSSGQTSTFSYYGTSTFPVTHDSDFNRVSLLLYGVGANGDPIVDSSALQKTMTKQGNAQISTSQSKFGTSSMYFDGNLSNPSVTTPASIEFEFGSGDFTIETWASQVDRNTGYAGVGQGVVGQSQLGSDSNASFLMYVYAGRPSIAIWSGGSVVSVDAANVLALSTWHHLAAVRSGNLVTLYVNGVSVGSTALTTAVNVSTRKLVVSGDSETGSAWNGYLSDLRLTKGLARYTASFTPPTKSFADEILAPGFIAYSRGDLQSTTNAVGHVTQYTGYDGSGRLRKAVDPKEIGTEQTYTPRGWLASTAVTPSGGTARTTSYTYDYAGQLTAASLPDGTTLGYSYDAAHRLIGITDTRGNTVTYTLDNVGNRIREETKDPQGTLARSITRVYDALNRVQQTTGANN